MSDEYLLQWTYTPANYFEEPVDFACSTGTVHLENGKAEARIPSDKYPADHSARDMLHRELESRFLGAQLLSHTAYTLTKPCLFRIHPDGRRDAWIFVEPAQFKISGGSVDFLVRGADGSIVRDTKRERIDERKEFAELAARFAGDAVASAILRSYDAAVHDPQNELVHLYEIREALAKHFGGESAATAAVGVSAAQWSRLGHLANGEPLSQGRHRGKQFGVTRAASAEELSEVRAIARRLSLGYMRHLKGNAP